MFDALKRLLRAQRPENTATHHYEQGLAHREQRRFAEAAACYRRALAMKPDYAEAHNNLGAILQLQQDLDGALACYERAVALSPRFSQPYLNLGRLLESRGRSAEAAACYRRALELDIEPATFRHLLNAAEGVTTERAPADYARTVFDEFAEGFDERLVGDLGYRMPQILCERLRGLHRDPDARLRVLDLGCGTGLCGLHAAGFAAHLVGVDLSPRMLAKARTRGVYHELVESDIAEYLRTAPASGFDAVLAADVFIYIGELEGIFRETARVLRGGGIFAFTIELAAESGGEYQLLPSGRYAQSASYITRLALAAGLDEVESSSHTIRGGPGSGIAGRAILLRKP